MSAKKTGITDFLHTVNRAYKELASLTPKERTIGLTLISENLDKLAEEEAQAARESTASNIPVQGPEEVSAFGEN